MWSLGVTLYAMVMGEPPFTGGDFDELVGNVMSLRYTPPKPPALRHLVHSMLQRLPSERPTIVELCADGWVTGGGHLTDAIELPPTPWWMKAEKGSSWSAKAESAFAGRRGVVLYALAIAGAVLWSNCQGEQAHDLAV